MEENKVTKDTSTEEHRHHHHHHHHHHSDEHGSSKGRGKKRSRKHRGFYTVSNNVLMIWSLLLTIAILLLLVKIYDMNAMINRLAEFHGLSLGETVIEREEPLSPDDIDQY